MQAAPVIIGDNSFIGSRCIVVEGVHVEDEGELARRRSFENRRSRRVLLLPAAFLDKTSGRSGMS